MPPKNNQISTNSDFCFSFNACACESCGGKCCVGESGYIFVTLEEARQISAFLKISFEDFALKYLKKVKYSFSLIEKPHPSGMACVFFDDDSGKCAIYDVRPKQCVSFPFWEGFKNKSKAELQELISLCPGVCAESRI